MASNLKPYTLKRFRTAGLLARHLLLALSWVPVLSSLFMRIFCFQSTLDDQEPHRGYPFFVMSPQVVKIRVQTREQQQPRLYLLLLMLTAAAFSSVCIESQTQRKMLNRMLASEVAGIRFRGLGILGLGF